MTTTALDALRTMEPDEARHFFATADPEELVAVVRATDDAELLDLIGRPDVRSAAVPGILARLDEYSIAERLAEVSGVARFDLTHGSGRRAAVESHVLDFADGRLSALSPDEAPHDPDVVISTSLLCFVRLVSGECNAALAFLAGDLDIDGDEMLALAVGSLFRVPGTDQVAVDPTALDVVDVATVLRDAPTDHLRKVMAGGLRPIVLDEVFRRLPGFVNPRRATKARLVIALRLAGRPDGEVDRYVVQIADGQATVTEGDVEGVERDATVMCEAHDFLRLATGNLSAVRGVMTGQLKVRGDRGKALQLTSVLDIPAVG